MKILNLSVFSCLIISIVIHSVLEILFPSMYGDQFMQIHSFYNFVDGNGITLSTVQPQDLSKIEYEKLNLWALGFVFINYPLYYIFGSVTYTTIGLNIFFIIVFFVSIYKILYLLDAYFSNYTKSIILIFFSIAIMPSRYMGATDVWCLGLLFFTFYFTLHFLIVKNLSARRTIFQAFIIIISVGMMVSLRYTYWALAFTCPILFVLYSIIADRKLFMTSFIIFFACILFASSYIYYHFNYFGKILPDSLHNHTDIQWDTLKVYSPLYFNSFFRDSIVRSLFIKSIPGKFGIQLFQIIAQIFSFTFLIIVFVPIFKRYSTTLLSLKTMFSDNFSKFFILALGVVLINNVTILYSGLSHGYLYTNDLYPLGYSTVAEVRYYAPTLILFILLFFYTLSMAKNKFINFIFKSTLFFSLIFSLVINSALCLSRMGYQIPSIPKYLHYYQHNVNMYNSIKKLHKDFVYLPSPYSDLKDYYIATYAHIPEIRNSNWNQLNLQSINSVQVITLVNNRDTTLARFQPKILIHSLKPDIDLVEFTVKGNIN